MHLGRAQCLLGSYQLLFLHGVLPATAHSSQRSLRTMQVPQSERSEPSSAASAAGASAEGSRPSIHPSAMHHESSSSEAGPFPLINHSGACQTLYDIAAARELVLNSAASKWAVTVRWFEFGSLIMQAGWRTQDRMTSVRPAPAISVVSTVKAQSVHWAYVCVQVTFPLQDAFCGTSADVAKAWKVLDRGCCNEVSKVLVEFDCCPPFGG